MKVFITHAFGGGDEALANALKVDLGAAGLVGYLAEKTQRYDLMISDKIRQEIDESDWLVAIITKQSQASASVHEEIGYALGRGVRVALMVEEGVGKSGVLVYGREYEAFGVPEFGRHSHKMARFIAESPRPPPRHYPLPAAAEAFLEKRRILSDETANFAQNEPYRHLHSPMSDGDEKPTVLFTACPHDLSDVADVTAPKFTEWVRSVRFFKVKGHRIPIRETTQKIDIGTLQVVKRYPHGNPGRGILSYREFQNNGFFECGTSDLFVCRKVTGELFLHLPHMVGEFWGFIVYARSFYQKIKMGGRFTVLLSIRNSSELALEDHGDEAADPDRLYMTWLQIATRGPRTSHHNIQLPHTFASADGLGDEEIASAVHKAAKMVCNAYGVPAPRCYDGNGRFAWRLWGQIIR